MVLSKELQYKGIVKTAYFTYRLPCAKRGIYMDVIMENAFLILSLLAMIGAFRLFHNGGKNKKLWLILDMLTHMALVSLMLWTGATMEELLLVLLVALTIGLA